jgi:hypothetical protein
LTSLPKNQVEEPFALNRDEEADERFYDIHGAVKIRLVGRDPVSDIIHRTLDFFSAPPGPSDLSLVLGRYPGQGWDPEGALVGDRYLYDPGTDTTTVLGSRIVGKPSKSNVEYIIAGDLRRSKPVTAFIPRLRTPLSPGMSFRHDLRHGNSRRAFLALVGNPFGLRDVVRQAERITEAIIEPFLFYRLPEKGLSLVHAASVSVRESADLLAGSANVGKSTLALRSVKEKMGFLGDSSVILSETGDALPYPGLVKLHRGHLALFPEFGDRLAAGLGGLGASLLRRELLADGSQTIDLLPQRKITELFDGVVIPRRMRLRMCVHVARGSFGETRANSIGPEQLARSLAADLFWGFEAAPWRNAQFIGVPSAHSGSDLAQESVAHHGRVEEVLRRATLGADCFSVSLPFDAPVLGVEELVRQSEGA